MEVLCGTGNRLGGSFCGGQLQNGPSTLMLHLDLVLPNEEELVRDVKTSVSLGGRDYEIVVSQIPREMGKESRRAQTLDMRE